MPSILEKAYYKSNSFASENEVFFVDAKVSYLDVLKENEVEVVTKDYLDCECKDSKHINDYFSKCSKCDGKGYLTINGHECTCNKCKGNKVIRHHDCYLCNNKGKILKNSKIKIKLRKDYKDNEVINYQQEGYTLLITLHIYDFLDYHLENNDIYYLRAIDYTESDYRNKVSKKIRTFVSIEQVKSEFKVKKEIVCLSNKGIDGGNFYFAFNNEVEANKVKLHRNVIINGSGYVSVLELSQSEVVTSSEYAPLNKNYIYVDESVSEYENDENVFIFNKLDAKYFSYEDGRVIYNLQLTKEDLLTDKKVLLINGEKVTISYKKNLKEDFYCDVSSKVVVSGEGKKANFLVRVIPSFEHIYKISIKRNNALVYVENYKYEDYRLVKTFKKGDYLDNPLKILDEEKINVDNDLILIKRV